MRSTYGIALAAAIAAASTATAAAPAQPGDSATTAREVAAAEARLERALARRDRAALESLVAAPFTWVHASDGRVDTREVWLADAARGTALAGQRDVRTAHGPALAVYGAAGRSGPHTSGPHTAVRGARVRLRDSAGTRERWLRQTHLFVRGADGAWRLAWGQGTLMYEGPPLDTARHARYAGTYVVAPGRVLRLAWEEGALVATFPNGSRTQIFLASPTEEAVRTEGGGRLRFTLAPDGRPSAAALVRGPKEVWRAVRSAP